MALLVRKLREHLTLNNTMNNILDTLTYKSETKEKKYFYASDFGKPILDTYLKFKGVPETNPPKWFETLKWGAGKGVEMSMLEILKQNGIVAQDYNQEEHGGFKMERNGVTISGYMDAIHKDLGVPIEIKSINNKNEFDIRNYENGYPRENYVGQLAIYMDNLGVDTGFLFVSSVDGLNTFWFECKRVGDGLYQCGNVTVDLNEQYRVWGKLYNEYVLKDVEPSPFQYIYKKDIEKIDWKSLSSSDISKARTGKKVIGDWQITYSPYKDLIIKKQGAELGYSLAELERINELTKGYTTWGKERVNVQNT